MDLPPSKTLLADARRLAETNLSKARLGHTLRVAQTSERLAKAHGADPDRALLAALIHDATREIGGTNLLHLAEGWDLPVGRPERESPKLLHGPVAAELARRELGVTDEGVLQAVREHTVAAPGMSDLSLILYLADKIEPARDYPSVERIRHLAERDLRAAATEALRRSVAYNEKRGKPTHPDSLRALAWLEGDEGPDEPRSD